MKVIIEKIKLPEKQFCAFEGICKNDIKQTEVNQLSHILTPQALEELVIPNKANLIQYYTTFKQSTILDKSSYINQGTYIFGSGIECDLKTINPPAGTAIRTANQGEYLVFKIETPAESIASNVNYVWENEIWVNKVHEQRSFVFDFVKFILQENNQYKVEFYIGIK